MAILTRWLGFDPRTMRLRTEMVAGLTTFLTMSYVLAVNPAVLGATGMDREALFTVTALVSAVATLLLAFMAKLPFAQAPSVGLNAFFAFTLVQGMGYSWQEALAALLTEGVIFILITFLNIRERILEALPGTLRHSVSAGIGMFIAFIGLKQAGIIEADPSTFVRLGRFTHASVLAMGGIVLSGVLMALRVRGALFYGIAACTLVGIPLGVTVIPDGFSAVSVPYSPAPTFCKFDFSQLLTPDMAVVILTLLFMNVFDTVGTLIGLASKTGIVGSDGRIPRVKEAMLSDAVGTTFAAVMGCSTVTTYVESASGIAEGGRSGVTAFVVAVLFLAALFFGPLFLLIPPAATVGAMVLVGAFMIDSVARIDLNDISEALPAFVTMLMTVLTYSIVEGIVLGILCYVLVKMLSGRYREVSRTMYVLALLLALKYIFF